MEPFDSEDSFTTVGSEDALATFLDELSIESSKIVRSNLDSLQPRTPLKARWTVLLRYLLIDLFRWLLRQFDRYLINRFVLTRTSAFHAHFSLRKGLALEKLIVLHTQPRRRQLLHDIVLPNCHLSEAQSRTVDLWQVVMSPL